MKAKKSAGYSAGQKKLTKKRKLTKRKVLKMLAVMESQEQSGAVVSSTASGVSATSTMPENNTRTKEFLSTGRTGRRNALPNVLSDHAVVSSSDLPDRLQALSTSEKSSEEGSSTGSASTSAPSGSGKS